MRKFGGPDWAPPWIITGRIRPSGALAHRDHMNNSQIKEFVAASRRSKGLPPVITDQHLHRRVLAIIARTQADGPSSEISSRETQRISAMGGSAGVSLP